MICLVLPAIRSIAVTIAVFTLMALRPGGYLPGMYVIVLLPFFAIAIAAVLDRLHTLVTSLRATGAPAIRGRRDRRRCSAAAAFAVAPGWLDRTGTALTAHTNLAHDQAVDWAGENLDEQSLIVSDNTYWNDLVNAGWDRAGTARCGSTRSTWIRRSSPSIPRVGAAIDYLSGTAPSPATATPSR